MNMANECKHEAKPPGKVLTATSEDERLSAINRDENGPQAI